MLFKFPSEKIISLSIVVHTRSYYLKPPAVRLRGCFLNLRVVILPWIKVTSISISECLWEICLRHQGKDQGNGDHGLRGLCEIPGQIYFDFPHDSGDKVISNVTITRVGQGGAGWGMVGNGGTTIDMCMIMLVTSQKHRKLLKQINMYIFVH